MIRISYELHRAIIAATGGILVPQCRTVDANYKNKAAKNRAKNKMAKISRKKNRR